MQTDFSLGALCRYVIQTSTCNHEHQSVLLGLIFYFPFYELLGEGKETVHKETPDLLML
uniref:Uncharacterized protein n=1 Tax=Rhizophora mucronata TaxID=61149 RepID=A0A2P2PT68_RHIMU